MHSHTTCRPRGFTLIELLIVVAIIAILAAIAVPNFLEAQTRAKVSRAKADIRSLMTAMEMYKIDTNKYIYDNIAPREFGEYPSYAMLTTPIAYISSIPPSPFDDFRPFNSSPIYNTYQYWGWHEEWPELAAQTGVMYYITSVGPNNISDYHTDRTIWHPYPNYLAEKSPLFYNGLYDATNGTKSIGDLVASNLGYHN